MRSAHSILACARWWRTGPCRIPDTQKAVKGAWVQNSHTRCFHFLCSLRPSPLMGNRHQTVKSNTPINKTLGGLVLGSFWDHVIRKGAADRQAHLPERMLSCTQSRYCAFSCLHLGGCICMWEACEGGEQVIISEGDCIPRGLPWGRWPCSRKVQFIIRVFTATYTWMNVGPF